MFEVLEDFSEERRGLRVYDEPRCARGNPLPREHLRLTHHQIDLHLEAPPVEQGLATGGEAREVSRALARVRPGGRLRVAAVDRVYLHRAGEPFETRKLILKILERGREYCGYYDAHSGYQAAAPVVYTEQAVV